MDHYRAHCIAYYAHGFGVNISAEQTLAVVEEMIGARPEWKDLLRVGEEDEAGELVARYLIQRQRQNWREAPNPAVVEIIDVELWQMDRPWTRFYAFSDVGPEAYAENVLPEMFTKAARWHLDGNPDPVAELERLYAETQHVVGSWMMGPSSGLVWSRHYDPQVRSTSIGDVFTINGVSYRVCSLGFEEVPGLDFADRDGGKATMMRIEAQKGERS